MNFRESELSSKFLQSLNQVLSDLEISNEVKILTDVKLEIVNVYSFIFDLALKYLNYEIYIEFLCTRQKISTNQFSWVWGLKN